MAATLRHNKVAVVVCNTIQPNAETMTPIHKLTRAEIRKLEKSPVYFSDSKKSVSLVWSCFGVNYIRYHKTSTNGHFSTWRRRFVIIKSLWWYVMQSNAETMTPIHKLTRAKILKLTQNGMHSDGGGLFVEVTNGGSGRSWLFKYRLTGTRKQRLMGLGSLNKISLAEARVLAHEYREMVKAGLDPLVKLKRTRLPLGGGRLAVMK
jgi:hypothetical protein